MQITYKRKNNQIEKNMKEEKLEKICVWENKM